MALPYSDDLRTKLLEAYEAGAGSLRELASQFRVSWGYSKKIRAHQVRTGNKERTRQQRSGPISRIPEKLQKDLIVWLRERLAARGVAVSKSRVGQLLRKLGMKRKKNRSTPLSGILRPTSSAGKSSSTRSA